MQPLVEKKCTLVEIGSIYCRVGFVGMSSPNFVFQLPLSIRKLFSSFDALQAYSAADQFCTEFSPTNIQTITDQQVQLYLFWNHIFVNLLQYNASQLQICISLNILLPGEENLKELLSNFLKTQFQVLSVQFVCTQHLPLFISGLYSGCVIDIGYRETRIVPLAFGKEISHCIRMYPIGMYQVLENLQQKIIEVNPKVNREMLSFSVLEDICFRLCYCQEYNSATTISSSLIPPLVIPTTEKFRDILEKKNTKIKYSLSKCALDITEEVRTHPCELLFTEQDTSPSCVTSLFLDSILSLDQTLQVAVMSNIICCGGGACLTGFLKRFVQDLQKHLTTKKCFSNVKNFTKKMRFLKNNELIPNPSQIAWIGGSVYLETVQ